MLVKKIEIIFQCSICGKKSVLSRGADNSAMAIKEYRQECLCGTKFFMHIQEVKK